MTSSRARQVKKKRKCDCLERDSLKKDREANLTDQAKILEPLGLNTRDKLH